MNASAISEGKKLIVCGSDISSAQEVVPSVKVGRVVSTSGNQLVVLLSTGSVSPEMGSLVRIRSPYSTVYGVVEGLSIPMPSEAEGERAAEIKMAEIGLLGEVTDSPGGMSGRFRRGVSKLPSLDCPVYLASEKDIATVYSPSGGRSVSIGTVYQDPRVPAQVSVDGLLAKHVAFLGSTGIGKSCAVTLVLKRILEHSPNAHILLLDPHGEYGVAFGDQAEHLTVSNFRLPFWVFTFEELTEVVFGSDRSEMLQEMMYFRELVVNAKTYAMDADKDTSWITVDSPVPFTFADVGLLLEKEIGGYNKGVDINAYLRIKARLAALQSDKRYTFLFEPGIVRRDTFAALLGRIFRVPCDGKPLAILDLAAVPSEVLNVIVSVICRLAFDFALWAGQHSPILLVCEEAHRYAPQDPNSGFEPAKRSLSRIAKEGRKYGISLALISQRPCELSQAILSQCGTVFSFRMANERDQAIIQASLSDASPAMFAALPFLGDSEALAIGDGVPVPMRLRFDTLAETERPRSSSALFSQRWQRSDDGLSPNLNHVVQMIRGNK